MCGVTTYTEWESLEVSRNCVTDRFEYAMICIEDFKTVNFQNHK